MNTASLILASSSPRRRDLLAELGVEFEVLPSTLAEPSDRAADVPPANWAEALAYFKARAVAREHPGRWVLGYDTVVSCGREILGKPGDEDDARRMLLLQAGRSADVITGVALLSFDERARRDIRHAITRVWLRNDRDEIERYLATGDWRGKAGAYGIQTVHDRLVARRQGSFSNVVGLPQQLTSHMLADAGFDVVALRADVRPVKNRTFLAPDKPLSAITDGESPTSAL